MPVAVETKPVHITDDHGAVDEPYVTISISAHQEITWYAHGNEQATIVFYTQQQGSPFQVSVFPVPAGGSTSSGQIKTGALPQHYKYSVIGPKGANDPEVIIEG